MLEMLALDARDFLHLIKMNVKCVKHNLQNLEKKSIETKPHVVTTTIEHYGCYKLVVQSCYIVYAVQSFTNIYQRNTLHFRNNRLI